jgi:hypothetical protein
VTHAGADTLITWHLILTAGDFAALREHPASMSEVMDAVESAIIAHHRGTVRQGRLVDRVLGEFEGACWPGKVC